MRSLSVAASRCLQRSAGVARLLSGEATHGSAVDTPQDSPSREELPAAPASVASAAESIAQAAEPSAAAAPRVRRKIVVQKASELAAEPAATPPVAPERPRRTRPLVVIRASAQAAAELEPPPPPRVRTPRVVVWASQLPPPPPPPPPREGPPRRFTSRLLGSPEARAAAEAAERERLEREGHRSAAAPFPRAARWSPSSSAEAEVGEATGERSRNRRTVEARGVSRLPSALAPGGAFPPRARRQPSPAHPNSHAGRSTRMFEQLQREADAARGGLPPHDYDVGGLTRFLRIGLDPLLDTGDVGTTPARWVDLRPRADVAEAAFAENEPMLRALSGVSDDEEWRSLVAGTLKEFKMYAAAEDGVALKRGGSLLPHAQAEDQAVSAALLDSLPAGDGDAAGARAFALKALSSLTHNPGWSFAAKVRAASMMSSRLQAARA